MAGNSAAFARLKRINDLFHTGKAVVLDDDLDEPVAIWVQKLNSFQRGDAQKDGDYGRSRRIATLTEDTEEIQGLRRRIADYTHEMIVGFVLDPRQEEFNIMARSDIVADKKWEDRLNTLRDSATAERDGSHITPAESEAINKIAEEYLGELKKHADRRRADAARDLEALDIEELRDRYVDAFRMSQGAVAWQDEYQRTEVWYALRDCRPGPNQDPWMFTEHGHPQLLQDRAQIYDLPDELLIKVRETLRELEMTPEEAGNSVAPRTSSAPSEQPGTVEDSTPSTPAETSTKPAGTSSSPSPQPQPSSVG